MSGLTSGSEARPVTPTAQLYAKPEILLGDLRGGLCSSGLCRQLRAVAADEIERLTGERNAAQERFEEYRDVIYHEACIERDRLRGALNDLLPGLELDLRYADSDDDMDALRSRVRTVRDALGGKS